MEKLNRKFVWLFRCYCFFILTKYSITKLSKESIKKNCLVVNCAACDDPSICSECKSGFQLYKNNCQDCKVNNCSLCEVGKIDLCKSCKTGFFLNSKTTKENSKNEINFTEVRYCENCPKNCSKCINSQKCEICIKDSFKNKKNICIKNEFSWNFLIFTIPLVLCMLTFGIFFFFVMLFCLRGDKKYKGSLPGAVTDISQVSFNSGTGIYSFRRETKSRNKNVVHVANLGSINNLKDFGNNGLQKEISMEGCSRLDREEKL